MKFRLTQAEFEVYKAGRNAYFAEHPISTERLPDDEFAEQKRANRQNKVDLLTKLGYPGAPLTVSVGAVPEKVAVRMKKKRDERTPEVLALRRKIKEAGDWLIEQFPDCFVPSGLQPKVLKIGIIGDIKKKFFLSDAERELVEHALMAYRGRDLYYRALVLGAERIDLSGNVVGYVGEGDEGHIPARLLKAAA
jgi:hypothetical protein